MGVVWVVLVVLALVVLGGGLVMWKWEGINRLVRAGEVEEMALEVRRLAEEGDGVAAGEVLAEAIEIDGTNASVNRAAVALLEEEHPEEATRILYGLRARGDATLEDEVKLLELLVGQERFGEAGSLRDRLSAALPDDARVVLVSAKMNLAAGDDERFEELVKRAIELDSGFDEARLLLAKRRIESVIPERAEQAWKVIEEVAKSPEREGLEALLLIKEQGRYFVADEARYLELFRDHPDREGGAGQEPTIEILEWDLAIRPLEEEAIIEAALERWASLGDEVLNARLSWLNLNGYSGYVRAFTEGRDVGGKPALLAANLETAILKGDTEAALEEIEAAELAGDTKGRIEFARALVAIEERRPKEEIIKSFEWASSVALKEGNQGIVARGGTAALKLGELEAAEVVFRALMEASPTDAHRGLSAVAEKRGDYDSALDHVEALAGLEPGIHEVHEQVAYLQLLINRHLEQAKGTVRRLTTINPGDTGAEFLAAFSDYRSYAFDRAKKRCDRIDPDKLAEGQRAVLAVIYAAAGESERAEEILEGVSEHQLSGPEKGFLAEAGVELSNG
ncbi:MAG: hypothetical protein AAF591_19980 [Verrucomicrobiota bacterium]